MSDSSKKRGAQSAKVKASAVPAAKGSVRRRKGKVGGTAASGRYHSPYDKEPKTEAFPMMRRVPLFRSESFPVLSVDFADFWGFWLFYVLLVLMTWWMFEAIPMAFRFGIPALTLTNVAHSLLTIYFMHYRKGTMDSFDSGMYEGSTFWEIFDSGRHYTKAKKIFTISPIIICLAACYQQKWRKRYYVANCLVMILCLIPKHPAFDGMRIRLFGGNS